MPVGAPPIRDGALAIADGRIEAVGPASEVLGARANRPRIELPACIAIPGLVNAHTHLCHDELAPVYAPFGEWIEAMADRVRRATADSIDGSRVADVVTRGAARMSAGGVTAVGDSGPFPEAALAIARAGLRGRFYLELFGPDPARAPAALEAVARALDAAQRGLAGGGSVALGLAPHAPYTVSAALLGDAADWASQRGLPLAIHVAESREEEAYFRAQGPLAERLARRGIVTPARSGPVDWLETGGALGRELLLAHLTQATPKDLARLAAVGRVSAVVCPTANVFLGHGPPPVAAMLDARLPLALGTDGIATNPRQDLFEEMRQLLMLARPAHPISAARALEVATRGGAVALGLGARAGWLAPGMDADVTVIEPPRALDDPIDTVVLTTVREHVVLVAGGGHILHSTRGFPR